MKGILAVTGYDEIDKKLKRLPLVLQRKVYRQAMRVGMKVMATEVKGNTPVHLGITRAAVETRSLKRKRGRVGVEVRIKGKGAGTIKITGAGKRVYYPAVVEYGRKGVAPNPFMRRSFASKGESVRNITLHQLLNRTMIEVEKL